MGRKEQKMSEFKAIETQEEFDKASGERLKREQETVRKEYEGFLSPEDVQKKYEGFLSPEDVQEKYKGYLSPEQVIEKDATIKKYETKSRKVQIAMSEGIPYELAGRISGDTEEDMRKDAKTLAGFRKQGNPYPEYNPEPDGNKKTKEAAMKKMLNNLKGE